MADADNKHDMYAPCVALARLILGRAAEQSADKVLFGMPADSRLRLTIAEQRKRGIYPEERKLSTEESTAQVSMIINELMEQKEWGDPIPLEGLSNGKDMPIWFMINGVWQERESLPGSLAPSVLDAMWEMLVVHPSGVPRERKYIYINSCWLIEPFFVLEDSCCFSVELRSVVRYP